MTYDGSNKIQVDVRKLLKQLSLSDSDIMRFLAEIEKQHQVEDVQNGDKSS